MMRYSIEPKVRKYVNGYRFLLFGKNLANKYRKKLLDTEINILKTVSKKVIHNAAEATSEFIGNKITDKIVKPESNSKKCRRNKYSTRKKEEILNEI